MKPLGFTVPFHAGETLHSFASRLAAANGCPALLEFCRDMDIKVAALDRGDLDTIATLAELGAADFDAMRHSAILLNGASFSLGGNRLLRAQTVRASLRICAHCLREDIEDGSGPAHVRPWLRSAWSVRQVRTCVRHTSLLTTLDADIPQGFTHDVAFVVQNWGAKIQAAASSSEPLPRSPLEDWMVSKLAGVADEGGYLASLSFGVGTRLIETVGATIIHGKKFSYRHFTDRDWLDAGREGFRVAAGGEDSIRQHLATLHHQFHPTRAFGGVALFGNLYSRLFLAKDPDYDAVRNLIRDYVIDNFPLGPGDQLFGEIKRRRWHSITSASKEYGIRPVALRRLLRENSLIGQEKAELNDHSVLFDAASADGLLRQQLDTMIQSEARSYVGANDVQWDVLIRKAWVKPTTPHPRIKQPAYLRGELDEFVRSVLYSTGKGNPDSMCGIPKAARKSLIQTEDIIDLLRERKLEEVAIAHGLVGLSAVLINPREVRSKAEPSNWLTVAKASRVMMLRVEEVRALMAKGFLVTRKSRHRCRYVKMEDVNAFSAKYVSGPDTAELFGKPRAGARRIAILLQQLGVEPAISRSEVGLNFFEQSDLDRVRDELKKVIASSWRKRGQGVSSPLE